MSTRKYNPDYYTRKSMRLAGHDYTWTRAYYVTIRARLHEPVFDVPELRTVVEKNWDALPERFPGITLDEFIIMPDHVHFIVWLDGLAENAPTLGKVVGAFKSLTTVEWIRHIKATNSSWPFPLWQRDFYDRIIRDEVELERTRQYIRDNPLRLKERERVRERGT